MKSPPIWRFHPVCTSVYNYSDFGGKRTSNYTDVEETLFKWFQGARDHNIYPSGSILAAKTVYLALKLGHTGLSATHNWIDRFKQRRCIVSKAVFGESATVDKQVMDGYLETSLPNLLKTMNH